MDRKVLRKTPLVSPLPPRTVFVMVLALSLLMVFPTIDRGWVPHDEGTLAEPAVRILGGEIPHRDFDDMYTGGLSFLHAAAFKVAGENLLVLRFTLFLAFALWVPGVYYVARRLGGTAMAAAATLLAVGWSVPNYPASMPSWWNLFLATWGIVALIRFMDTRAVGWLLLAGAVGGVSVLGKIVGLYYLAGGLLFLVHLRQTARPFPERGQRPGSSAHTIVVTLSLLLFSGAVLFLVTGYATPETYFHFLRPPFGVAAFLIWNEWRVPAAEPGGESRQLFASVAVFLAGAALPIAFFLLPYAVGGGLEALVEGVLVLPRERFALAVRNPDPLWTVGASLPVAALFWASMVLRGRRAAYLSGVAALVGVALLVMGSAPGVYRGVWWSMRSLLPLAVVAGLVLLGRKSVLGEGTRESILFLLLAVASVHGLIQFPMAAPNYFFYVAPLLALVGLGLFASAGAEPRIPLCLAAFYLAFAVAWFHRGYIYQMGDYYAAHPPTEPLLLERGGIRVVPSEKAEVEAMAAVVDEYARGDHILALPDAPEVYFLTGKKNPTRTLFDFFAEDEGRVDRILDALDRTHVNLVVLNEGPVQFSGPPPEALMDSLRARFPRAIRTGRFVILWKD
jgi:hypothetical protein